MSIEPFRPTAFQSALLLLRLHELRDQEKKNKTKMKDMEEKKAAQGMTRFRVSELTLKRISRRPRLHPEFLTEMQADGFCELGGHSSSPTAALA